MSYKCMKKIIIKRIFKDKSDILRWNYKRSFKAFLKELRDLESFTSLSKLFHSLTALYENVRWPVDVLNLGIWSRSLLRVARSWGLFWNAMHQCHAKPHSTCFFFYHNIKDNERNLCQDLLTIENTAALCKWATCTRQAFLSKTFVKSLNRQKQYEIFGKRVMACTRCR